MNEICNDIVLANHVQFQICINKSFINKVDQICITMSFINLQYHI